MGKSPQLENGYTRLANELLDALLRAGLTSRQWAVAMAIVRKTYGFNKKEDDIGLSQIAEMTGIAKPHVSVTVRELESMKIITRKQGNFGHFLAINKHYASWGGVTKTVTVNKASTVQTSVTESVTGGYRISNEGVTESVTTPVTESVTTKDNLPKDSQKTTPKDTIASQAMRQRFARFYAAYPKKKSRAKAEKAFAKLNPDEQLVDVMIASVQRAMKSGQWDDQQYIPYPASWLNDRAWEDEIQTEYSATEQSVIKAFNDTLGLQLGAVDASIFSESRASAIRVFLGLSDKENFVERFFEWVRKNADLPPMTGFDYLISREGFAKVKSGQFNKKDAA